VNSCFTEFTKDWEVAAGHSLVICGRFHQFLKYRKQFGTSCRYPLGSIFPFLFHLCEVEEHDHRWVTDWGVMTGKD